MESTLAFFRRLIPVPLFRLLQPPYHYVLAALSSLYYSHPSRELFVVGITGTKGKSSVAELINAILEEAGHKTALLDSIQFKIGEEQEPNRYKMTMPGRFFIQRFLRKAVAANCRYAIIEMTSEGVKLHRHRFIELDALIFTNIAKEHIESHGSFEKYLRAKLAIRDQLERSEKRKKWMIANSESQHAEEFLDVVSATPVSFSLQDGEPYRVHEHGVNLTFDRCYIHSPLRGKAVIENILAAATFAKIVDIDTNTIKAAVEKLSLIPGRGELIDEGQPFTVVVDYAHTPESLEQLYETYKDRRKICVFGATGGGRDRWKRAVFGELAERYCDEIILTDEDSYDENPRMIVEEIASGIKENEPHIELDRRAAIRLGIRHAEAGDAVLITGKGTDPYIMGPGGSKTPWSDADIAREELQVLTQKRRHKRAATRDDAVS